MKIKVRFSLHFIIGLLLWILSMGLTIMLTIEVIFPIISFKEGDKGYDALVLMAFLLNITACSTFFAWYFGSPLWFIMTWIQQLTQGKYIDPPQKEKAFTKKGTLRKHYQLYKEVIFNIFSLSEHLKQAEQDREKIEEIKKDWIAGISHDLKTPLTYITGYSSLLLNQDYSWTENEKLIYIKEIAQKGEQIESLIEDLTLSFQMNHIKTSLPITLRRENIVEFTKSLIADIGNDPRAFEYNLSFECPEPFIEISFDVRLMYRVLQNLLTNALLHNPPGTNIHVLLKKQASTVTISISDDGIGMDQHTLDNIFQKYYRGTSTEMGTGLGMGIVKNLIHGHGGQIKITSEVSKGTTIHVTLPHQESEKQLIL